MLDDAIAQKVPESTNLEFKSEFPPMSGLPKTDYPKDIAAMANAGGGTILYGITEEQKCAAGRCHVELSEVDERTLRQVAVSAITPPVLGLQIVRIDDDPSQTCIAVTVPATLDGPHLVYRNDYFGAPLRNDADTVWMREPQLEAMYRARFDRHRHLAEQLNDQYAQTLRGRDIDRRAWFVAVAIPSSPVMRSARMTRDEAQACFVKTAGPACKLAPRSAGPHPLESTDLHNPRPGFRGWVAPSVVSESTEWARASATVADTGTVSLAAALGARPSAPGQLWPGNLIRLNDFECAIADFLGLVRSAADHFHTSEYDVQIGLAWSETSDPLGLLVPDPMLSDLFRPPDGQNPMHFVPVRTTLLANVADDEFRRQAFEIALDCVNQGGITRPSVIAPTT